MTDWYTKETKELLQTILALEDLDEAKRFFRDLLSENELTEFGKRWKVARMLDAGSSYTDIVAQTGLSSTTIARISKWLTAGEGGYAMMLKRRSR